MTLAFRNLDVGPQAPVEQWPMEGIATALERGTISDWRRINAAIKADPWGPVATKVEDWLAVEDLPGVGPLMLRAIARARQRAEADERAAVAAEIDGLVRDSGVSAAEFAKRIGTSGARLSTYRSGKVTPSAALLLRMRAVAARLPNEGTVP